MEIEESPNRLLISVDGASGIINNTHLGGPYGFRQALVQAVTDGFSKDGAHGIDAPPAEPGAPGGRLAVQLHPLINERGISVQVLQPPFGDSSIAVSNGRLLRLSSCGGDGADGGRGGDGQDGKPGKDGRDADMYTDATAGEQGGNGGDAGSGSHGGAGGDGGRIEIMVDDADTNLLLSVYAVAEAGRGGEAGENGMPGRGGNGGQGGAGYEWSAHVGWDDNDVPVYSRRDRSPGKGGSGGRGGACSTFVPLPGPDGRPGEVLWIVRQPGPYPPVVYPSRYDFELQSFEISDENEDGIFEPGEHVFVHNIRVKNIGGMPTPSSWDIPVTIRPTAWISVIGETISDGERVAYLPRSIQPGETVTVPGKIKAMLCPAAQPALNQPLLVNERVRLIAIMPGLETEVPGFDYETPFNIKYPVEVFLDPNNLTAAPQNSEIKCAWRIRNVSQKPYGIQSASQRRIVIGAVGKSGLTLIAAHNMENPGPNVSREINLLEPGECTELVEYGRVDDTAEPYTKAAIDIALLLTPPPLTATPLIAPHEIQVNRQSVQVASRFLHHPDADVLLVANSGTLGDTVETWASFINESIGTPADTWNVSLYGGLAPENQIGFEADTRGILEAYSGKSVVLFGNPFTFFANGQRTIFDLCDPHMVNDELQKGSRLDVLVLPNYSVDACMRWLSAVVFPPASTDSRYRTDAPRKKDKLSGVIADIQHHYRDVSGSPSSFVYEVPITRFFPGRSKLKAMQRAANTAIRRLNKHLPRERFCIIISKEKKRILIMRGLAQETYLCIRPAASLVLDPYAAIASLPLRRRLEIQNPTSTTAIISEKPSLSPSSSTVSVDDPIFSLITLSITLDLYTEIRQFLSTASWPDTLVPGNFSGDFLYTHFPNLLEFLTFYKPLNLHPTPLHVSHPLQQVIAATRSQSHGERLTRTIMAGFHRRTRLRAFLLKAITTYLPKSEIESVNPRRGSATSGESETSTTVAKRTPLVSVLKKRQVAMKPRQTHEDIMATLSQALGMGRAGVEEKIFGSLRVGSQVFSEEEWEEWRRGWASKCAKMEKEMEEARKVVSDRLVDRGA